MTDTKEFDFKKFKEIFDTIQKVNEILKRGIPSIHDMVEDEKIACLHGTSLEALIRICNDGCIKPHTEKTYCDINGHTDRIYFVPFPKSFSSHPISTQLEDVPIKEIVSSLTKYARLAAFFSYFQERMPGVINSWDYCELIFNPKSREAESALKNMAVNSESAGYEPKLFLDTLQKAVIRKGAILAIDSRTLKEFEYHDGEMTPGKEVFIKTNEGIPMKYISGVEFISDTERDEFSRYFLLK